MPERAWALGFKILFKASLQLLLNFSKSQFPSLRNEERLYLTHAVVGSSKIMSSIV